MSVIAQRLCGIGGTQRVILFELSNGHSGVLLCLDNNVEIGADEYTGVYTHVYVQMLVLIGTWAGD